MRIYVALFSMFLVLLAPLNGRAMSEQIAAIVNQDAISISDVNDRMRLIITSSGLANNPEIMAKLSKQVVNSLIEEQIKLQEARRLELEITEEEIAQGFAAIAGQNKFEPEQFTEILKRSGINKATMERQIQAQIAWTKIVQSVVRSQVSVTDKDIEDGIARRRANKGRVEYLVAEIFLPMENAQDAGNVQQLANRLVGQIKAGQAPFFRVAQEFSKAAGASNGGDLGWVQQGQLVKEVDAVLKTMTKESVSQPIRSSNGFHILFLRDQRQITDETLPSADEMKQIIGNQRLDRAQRRYYQDLKAGAFIENRVAS